MKGLYVYGALSMALAFTVGVQSGNGLLAALSIAAALSAAASEAVVEVYDWSRDEWEWLVAPGNALALASWLLTAAAGFYAIFVSF